MNDNDEKKFSDTAKDGDNLTILSNRIAQIREFFCDGDNTEFAKKMQSSTNYTSSLCNGNKAIGKKILDKILDIFPDVSKVWLYFGEGPMLKGEKYTISTSNQRGNNYQGDNIRITPIDMNSIIASQQRTIELQQITINKQADRIDRLITILESKL